MATLPPSSIDQIASELSSIEAGGTPQDDDDYFEQVAQAIKATEGSGAGSVSHRGAQGAWQVMPETRRSYAEKLGLDPNDESEETVEAVARAKIADDLQSALRLANGDREKAAKLAAAAYFGGTGGMLEYAKGNGAKRSDGILNINQYVDRFSNKLGLPPAEKKSPYEEYWLKGDEAQSDEMDQAGRITRQRAADEAPFSTSLERGWEAMTSGVKQYGQLLTGDTEGAARTIAEKAAWDEKNPAPQQNTAFHDAWKDERYLDALTSGGFWSSNFEQLANSAPAMTGNIVGALAGFTVGGPGGALVGGFAGALPGNIPVEGGAKMVERLQKAGIDIRDQNAVANYLSANKNELLRDGAIKGAVVSTFDGAANVLGLKLFTGPVMKLATATDDTLVKMGVNLADSKAVQAAKQTPQFKAAIAPAVAEYRAATTLGATAGRVAGVHGLESAGEFGGEYVGQEASGDEGNFNEALLEAVMSVGQSAVTTAAEGIYSKLTEKLPVDLSQFPESKAGNQTPPASPSGTVPPAPQPNSPLSNAANAGNAVVNDMAANDPLKDRVEALRPLIEGERQTVQPSAELGGRAKPHTERTPSILDRLDRENRREILEAWALVRNPTVRPEQREYALAHLEQFLSSIPDFQTDGQVRMGDEPAAVPPASTAVAPYSSPSTGVGPVDPAAGSIPGESTRLGGDLPPGQMLIEQQKADAPSAQTATAPAQAAASVRDLALKEQEAAGWNQDWPFVPADLGNADFRKLIAEDASIPAEEKDRIFAAGKALGVVPKDEFPTPAQAAAPAAAKPKKAAKAKQVTEQDLFAQAAVEQGLTNQPTEEANGAQAPEAVQAEAQGRQEAAGQVADPVLAAQSQAAAPAPKSVDFKEVSNRADKASDQELTAAYAESTALVKDKPIDEVPMDVELAHYKLGSEINRRAKAKATPTEEQNLENAWETDNYVGDARPLDAEALPESGSAQPADAAGSVGDQPADAGVGNAGAGLDVAAVPPVSGGGNAGAAGGMDAGAGAVAPKKRGRKPKAEVSQPKTDTKPEAAQDKPADTLDDELADALGELGDALGDIFGAKMNITGKQYDASDLLPLLSKVVGLLVKKGMRSFAEAVGGTTNAMRANAKTAGFVDAISPRQWRAAYNSIADFHEGTEPEGVVAMYSDEDIKKLISGEEPKTKEVKAEIKTELDAKAHEAATSPLNDRPQPTEAMKEAGNYKLGHVSIQGLGVSIENPRGSKRSGVSPDGKAWENTLAHHYGYFKGSLAGDGDNVDVFLTDGAEEAKTAWVIDQKNKDGSFDELKVVLGPNSEAEAREAYLANYDAGWDGIGAITSMPMEAFKAWVMDGKVKRKPLAYVEPKKDAVDLSALSDDQIKSVWTALNLADGPGLSNEERRRMLGAEDPAEVREAIAEISSAKRPEKEAPATTGQDEPVSVRPFATSIEKTKTGWKIGGDPDKLAEHARDIFGKGVVKRKDGITLATTKEDVTGNFPVRFEEYRLPGMPERYGHIEVRVNQDGSAWVYGMEFGYAGKVMPSVAEALAKHREEFGDMTESDIEAGKAQMAGIQSTEQRLQSIKSKTLRFASGMSAISDLNNGAYARSGHSLGGIGVEASVLSKNGVTALANAILNWNVPVFVDSGAFGAFRAGLNGKPRSIDFDSVLGLYDAIYESIDAANPEEREFARPYLVMPDVVGDQAASLGLIRQHKNWIAGEIIAGNPIVPIQKGEKTLAEAYFEIVGILGTDKFVVGLPSNEAAITHDELRDFLSDVKPARVHFLGAASDKKLDPLLRIVAESVTGDVAVTADASQVRNKIIRGVKKGMSRADAITDALEDLDDPAVARWFSDMSPEDFEKHKLAVKAARRSPLESVAERVAEEAPAAHIEPGDVEPATPAVVAENVQAGAKAAGLSLKEQQAYLLDRIREAIAAAPEDNPKAAVDSAKGEVFNPAAVDGYYQMSGPDKEKAKDDFYVERDARIAELEKAQQFVEFDVPGDGKFKVLNYKKRLEEFAKIIEKNAGFKKSAPKSAPKASGSGGSVETTISDMLADGELLAARELAETRGKPFMYGSGNPKEGNRFAVVYPNPEPVEFLGRPMFVGRPFYFDKKEMATGPYSWKVIDVATGLSLASGATRDAVLKVAAETAKSKAKEIDAEIKRQTEAGNARGQDVLAKQWGEWATAQEGETDSERARKDEVAAEVKRREEKVQANRDAFEADKAKRAEEAKPRLDATGTTKDYGWKGAGVGAGGRLERRRQIELADGTDIEGVMYEQAGRYDSGFLRINGREVARWQNESSGDVQDRIDSAIEARYPELKKAEPAKYQDISDADLEEYTRQIDVAAKPVLTDKTRPIAGVIESINLIAEGAAAEPTFGKAQGNRYVVTEYAKSKIADIRKSREESGPVVSEVVPNPNAKFVDSISGEEFKLTDAQRAFIQKAKDGEKSNLDAGKAVGKFRMFAFDGSLHLAITRPGGNEWNVAVLHEDGRLASKDGQLNGLMGFAYDQRRVELTTEREFKKAQAEREEMAANAKAQADEDNAPTWYRYKGVPGNAPSMVVKKDGHWYRVASDNNQLLRIGRRNGDAGILISLDQADKNWEPAGKVNLDANGRVVYEAEPKQERNFRDIDRLNPLTAPVEDGDWFKIDGKDWQARNGYTGRGWALIDADKKTHPTIHDIAANSDLIAAIVKEADSIEAAAEKALRKFSEGTTEGMKSPLQVTFLLKSLSDSFYNTLRSQDGPHGKFDYLNKKKDLDITMKIGTRESFGDRVDLNRALKEGREFGSFKLEPRKGYVLATAMIDLKGEPKKADVPESNFGDKAETPAAAAPASPQETEGNAAETTRMMGIEVKPGGTEEVDGVRFELFFASSVMDNRAVLRQTDIDSGNVIGITTYENIGDAEKVIERAKKLASRDSDAEENTFTEAEALKRMGRVDGGTSGGIKTYAIEFYDGDANPDTGRGGARHAYIEQSVGRGGDKKFRVYSRGGEYLGDVGALENLREATEAAKKASLESIRADGYVRGEAPKVPKAEKAKPAPKTETMRDMLKSLTAIGYPHIGERSGYRPELLVTINSDDRFSKFTITVEQKDGKWSVQEFTVPDFTMEAEVDGMKKFRADLAELNAGRWPNQNPIKNEGQTEQGAEPVQAESAPAESRTYTLAEHTEFRKRLRDGEVTADELKATFQRLRDSDAALKAELNQRTLKDLAPNGTGGRKKGEVIDQIVRQMAGIFHVTGDSITYSPFGGQTYESALAAEIAKTTDEDIANFAGRVKAAMADREEAIKARDAALANPQTLDDFNLFVQVKGEDKLTPEQKRRFEDLQAEAGITKRAEQKEAKAEVSANNATVDAQIKQTKHTKTGQDLFVVVAGERVERNVFDHWKSNAKKMGGWWSGYNKGGAIPGFQFESMEAAEAFRKWMTEGDTQAASQVASERAEERAEGKDAGTVDRLREMADRLDEAADEELNRDRKTNTAKRARQASGAEESARRDKQLAMTMRNIASAIESGVAKFLGGVKNKAQIEQLNRAATVAHDAMLRKQFPSYMDYERQKGSAPTEESADYAEFPNYVGYVSDIRAASKALGQLPGSRALAAKLNKLISESESSEYTDAVKASPLSFALANKSTGQPAEFGTEREANSAIARSNMAGKATVVTLAPGKHVVVIDRQAAIATNRFVPTDRDRIEIPVDLAEDMLAKVEAFNKGKSWNNQINLGWYLPDVFDKRKRYASMNITNAAEFKAALREFIKYRAAAPEADRVKLLERALIGQKVGIDFFPTPESVAVEMVERAGIEEGMRVLEPSAGNGNIAEAIRQTGAEPDVIEISTQLQEVLKAKGFDVVATDFTDFAPEEGYDRIVMNPPFGNGQDIAHVRKAFDLLKPGGRLVAIVGEGAFTRSDSVATAFRDWIDGLNGEVEKLPAGTFNDPQLLATTGANARVVMLEKADAAPKDKEPAPEYQPSAEMKARADEQYAGWKGREEAPTSPNAVAVEVPAEKAPAEKIEDLGEKIGGARKDIAVSTGPKAKRESKDDSPAWAKRYPVVMNALDGTWFIADAKSGRSLVRGKSFETEAAAKAFQPIAIVGIKHRASQESDGKFYIFRRVSDRKRVKVIQQAFESNDEALLYMVQHAVEIIETKTNFGEEILPAPETVYRVGVPRRDGNVNGESFMSTFGFRGVEFGNWNNQEERQEVMNHAFDALHDLAELLGVPPRALSLNGELGLAFGARGQGLTGAKAHYEPGYAVINLTKMSGAGALAHEWMHGLDNYFARQDGKTKSEKVQNERGDMVYPVGDENPSAYMASHGFLRNNSGVREEVRAAYTKLVQALFHKAEKYVDDTARAERFVEHSRKELEGRIEKIRRELMEQKDPNWWKRKNAPADAGQMARFEEAAKKILEGQSLDVEFRYTAKPGTSARARGALAGRMTNDAVEEIAAVYKEVRGRSGFSGSGLLDYLVSDMRGYANRLAFAASAAKGEEKTRQTRSDYAIEAYRLDAGRVGDYWTTEHEMLARAFAAYAEDKLQAQSHRSDFLVFAANNDQPGFKLFGIKPYPEGQERIEIAKAFDEFLRTIKVQETEKGLAIYASTNGAAPINAGDWLSVAQITEEVQKVLAEVGHAPNFDIFDRVGDTGLNAEDGGVAAFVVRQRLGFVRSGLEDEASVRRAAWHEVFHYGLRRFLDRDSYIREMNRLYDIDPQLASVADAWVNNDPESKRLGDLGESPAYLRARGMDEALAKVAEDGIPQIGILERLKLWIADIAANFGKTGREFATWLRAADNREARSFIFQAFARLGDDKAPVVRFDGDRAVYMTAYHGSPHDHDGFDLSKIGTGEGAQAYGYGHYFAGAREVAEHYRRILSVTKHLSENQFNADGTPNRVVQAAYQIDGGIANEDVLDGLMVLGHSEEEARQILRDAQKLFRETNERAGRLYTVDLKPEESDYLLWDKPLSEQSEKVKAAIESLVDEQTNIEDGDSRLWKLSWSMKSSPEFVTGQQIYEVLADQDGQKAASEYLLSLGIRGIKYLDGSSRSAGEGNFNYVIFSDEDVEIVGKESRTHGSDQREVEIVRVDYSGMGESPTWRDATELARERFQGKSFRNDSTKKMISVGSRGIHEALHNASPAQVKSLAALDEIIRTGVLIDRKLDRKGRPEIAEVDTFVSAVEIDGTLFRVTTTVNVTKKSGDKYYGHEIASIEIEVPGSTALGAPAMKAGAAQSQPGMISIAALMNGSSRESRGTGVVGLTRNRIEGLQRYYGYGDGRTWGMLAWVDPLEFVSATTKTSNEAKAIREEAGEVDMERLRSEDQTPFLSVSQRDDGTWKITSHEGRHRMAALAKAGYKRVPVVLEMRDNGNFKDPRADYSEMDGAVLEEQFGGGLEIDVGNLIPIRKSADSLEQLLDEFGRGDVLFSMGATSTGLPAQEVRQHIAAFRGFFPGANQLDIRAVQSRAELPEGVKASPRAEGVYLDARGQIFLIAGNLPDATRVYQVLQHETIGHYGLESMGEKYDRIKAAVLSKARANGPVTGNERPGNRNYATIDSVRIAYADQSEDVQAAEVLARLTEIADKPTWFKAIVAMVRQWMKDTARKFGLSVDYSMKDAEDLIQIAAARLRNPFNGGPGGGIRDSQTANTEAYASKNVGSLADDLARQEKWLMAEAKKLGYRDIEDMLEKGYAEFEKLAAKWRAENPVDALQSRAAESRNLDSDEDSINIEDVESLFDSEKALDEAESLFLSSFPESTWTYRRTSPTARAAKAASERARWEFGGADSGRGRDVLGALGPFSGYHTKERRSKGLDGKEQLTVQVFGKEQVEAGLGYAPALNITVEENGEVSIYGPPWNSPLYKAFSARGWAEPTTDAEGNTHETLDGGFWTKLTDSTRRQAIDLLGDAHARALDWLGVDHLGMHWKRTTGSTGNKGGREGAIWFSKGEGSGTVGSWFSDPAGAAKQARDYLNDTFRGDTAKSFNWWHRTVGSQFHKAQVNPFYGKVFRVAQRFIDDVARYGTEASDMAPDLLPKMDTIAGAFREAWNYRRDEADSKAIAAPIFEGTLFEDTDEAGNEIKGKVWTDQELRDKYQLTDRQIELYRQFRKAVDHSLEELAKAEMNKVAKVNALLPPTTSGLSMNALADFYHAQFKVTLDELKKQLNELNQRIESGDKVLLQNARDNAAGYEAFAASKALKDAQDASEQLRLMREIESLEKLEEATVGKARLIKKLQKEGYAPLMRFGKYTLDVVERTTATDENGDPMIDTETGEEVVEETRHFFGMFETEKERREAEKIMAEEYPNATITPGVMSEDGYQLFGAVNPGSLEMLARLAGNEDEVIQRFYKEAVASRSALKRLIHRQGIEGYSEDVTRTLASFIMSNARATASAKHFGDLMDAAADIPKQYGDVKDEAVKMINYIRDPNEEAGMLRGLLFMQFLGGSVAAAAVNLTQTLTTTAPYLHQYGVGVKDLVSAGTLAAKRMAKDEKPSSGSAALDVALKHAEEEGVIAPHNIHALMGETGTQGLTRKRWFRVAQHLWGSMFGMAEQFNRETAFIAAFRAAEKMGPEGLKAAYKKASEIAADRGLPPPSPEAFRSPYALAKQTVQETQFVLSKAARPNWARGTVGATLFTFKQFAVNYLELLRRMPNKERGLALAALIVLAGAGGAPGADDLDDLIDTLGQGLGYDTNSKKWKHEVLRTHLGPMGEEFVMNGVSAFLPLDLSNRLGMGNLIPASGFFQRSTSGEYRGKEAAEILGAAGGYFKQLSDAWDYTLQGRYGMAVAQGLAPKAIKDAIKGAEMAQTGIYDDTKGRMVTESTTLDAFVKAIGFQPSKVANIQEQKYMQQQDNNLQRAVKEGLSEQWARAIFERDAEATKKVRELIKEWNERNPNTKIDIKIANVQKRVQAMRKDALARFKASTPKEMRANMEARFSQ